MTFEELVKILRHHYPEAILLRNDIVFLEYAQKQIVHLIGADDLQPEEQAKIDLLPEIARFLQ